MTDINSDKIVKGLSPFLAFDDKAVHKIIAYCGLNEAVILSRQKQLKLFGFLFQEGYINIICHDYGVTVLDEFNKPIIGYSWHGLVKPLVEYIIKSTK